ncbi:DUF461 domain-containing protein [Streptacidiphilus sp. 4-A2]|nr:DUF461 domain-containing protein [Streptacidiphilus sp. 4-A2]
MSRSLRRGAVAAVIIATAPVLAACSAGDGAATLQVKPDSAATSIGSSLKLNGITVITATNGSNEANVVVSIANQTTTAETLTGVSVSGTPATLSGPAVIPPLGSLLVSGPGQVSATVADLTQTAGQNVPVTFTFSTNGSVSTQALVNAGTGDYAAYAPSTPSASPTPSTPVKTTGKATGKPSDKVTGKTTGKTSPNPSSTAH